MWSQGSTNKQASLASQLASHLVVCLFCPCFVSPLDIDEPFMANEQNVAGSAGN